MRVERAPSAANTRRFRSPIQAHLEAIHARYAGLHEGQVAAYIPELAKANPDWFAICLATNDGYLYEIGDSRQPFTKRFRRYSHLCAFAPLREIRSSPRHESSSH